MSISGLSFLVALIYYKVQEPYFSNIRADDFLKCIPIKITETQLPLCTITLHTDLYMKGPSKIKRCLLGVHKV